MNDREIRQKVGEDTILDVIFALLCMIGVGIGILYTKPYTEIFFIEIFVFITSSCMLISAIASHNKALE